MCPQGRPEGESAPKRASAEGRTVSVLAFTKMQGLGNDFVVVDGRRQSVRPLARADRACSPTAASAWAATRCWWSSRRSRPGGRLPLPHLQRRRRRGRAVRQRRALLRRVRARAGLTDRREIRVETRAGVIVPRLEDDGQVTVDMGVPRFAPERCRSPAAPASPVRSARRRRHDRRGLACCRWAIRTRCRSSPTSTRRRWRPRARASKATRASRARQRGLHAGPRSR